MNPAFRGLWVWGWRFYFEATSQRMMDPYTGHSILVYTPFTYIFQI